MSRIRERWTHGERLGPDDMYHLDQVLDQALKGDTGGTVTTPPGMDVAGAGVLLSGVLTALAAPCAFSSLTLETAQIGISATRTIRTAIGRTISLRPATTVPARLRTASYDTVSPWATYLASTEKRSNTKQFAAPLRVQHGTCTSVSIAYRNGAFPWTLTKPMASTDSSISIVDASEFPMDKDLDVDGERMAVVRIDGNVVAVARISIGTHDITSVISLLEPGDSTAIAFPLRSPAYRILECDAEGHAATVASGTIVIDATPNKRFVDTRAVSFEVDAHNNTYWLVVEDSNMFANTYEDVALTFAMDRYTHP